MKCAKTILNSRTKRMSEREIATFFCASQDDESRTEKIWNGQASVAVCLKTPTVLFDCSFGIIMSEKKIFYNASHLFSYSWAWIFVEIGARRRGKTFDCLKKMLNRFLYHNEQFVILRDTQSECDAIEKDNGFQLLGEVVTLTKFARKIKSYAVKGGTVFINDEIAGFIKPANQFAKFKGTQYSRVKFMLYDEFIPENYSRYAGDRAWQFANSLMTIGSLRKDFRIVLTANALNNADTILNDILGIEIDSGKFGIYKRRSKGVVCEYIPNNKEFENYQKQSNIYKLIKGTRYANNLLENKFLNEVDSDLFYKRKPKSTLFGIYYDRDGQSIRLYEGEDGLYYASQDLNKNATTYMRFCFDIRQQNGKVKLATRDEFKQITELFKNNLIKFENSYIMKVFKNIIANGYKGG